MTTNAAILLAGAAGLAFASIASAADERTPPRMIKTRESVVDLEALVYSRSSWGTCPNGKSFQLNALSTHKGWQYATWYDAKRRLCVGRRKLPDGVWETVHFDDYVHKATDTHNTTQLGICPADGTLHMAFDHHGSPLHYRVSRKGVTTRPDAVKWAANLFGPVTSKLNPDGPREGSVTYPTFCRAPGGDLFLLWRRGGSGGGDWRLAEYDGKAGAWKALGAVLSGKGAYKDSASRCAYPNGIDFDAKDRLHLTWCWRESPNPMSNHDVCYAYSDDRGRTWFNNAGERAGETGETPLRVDTPGIAAIKVPTGRGLINTTGQAVDGKGRIHVVTWHLPSGAKANNWSGAKKNRRYFHYWRDLEGAWHRNAIAPRVMMGARPKLCFDARDNLYVVFKALGVATATAAAQWKNWTVAYAEPGTFLSEPAVDVCRWRGESVLSIYAQRRPEKPGGASPLCVFDLKPAGGPGP